MKTPAFAVAAILAFGAIVPAVAQTTPPKDTGNMAYPAPLPQGNLSTTTTTAPRTPTDTGSAAFPAPLPQGNLSTTNTTAAPRAPTDTGNMAYPTPMPQGTVATTPVQK